MSKQICKSTFYRKHQSIVTASQFASNPRKIKKKGKCLLAFVAVTGYHMPSAQKQSQNWCETYINGRKSTLKIFQHINTMWALCEWFPPSLPQAGRRAPLGASWPETIIIHRMRYLREKQYLNCNCSMGSRSRLSLVSRFIFLPTTINNAFKLIAMLRLGLDDSPLWNTKTCNNVLYLKILICKNDNQQCCV